MSEDLLGIFSQKDLFELIKKGEVVTLPGFDMKHVGPASIDLTVSDGEAYRVNQILRPSGRRKEKVRDLLPAMGAHKISVGDILEPGCSYLVKATINISLPKSIYAFANAKSSSGRNMLLCRTLVDAVEGFDTLSRHWEDSSGEVWIVIQPLVFPTILSDKECYLQVRFNNKDTRFSDEDLHVELKKQPLLYKQDGSVYEDLSLFSGDGTVFTTLYAKAGKLVGFRAKQTGMPLNLEDRNLNPEEYFEPVYAESDPADETSGLITLFPGWYYLLSTNERLHVPEHLSSELVALNPRFGLFFSHFAGYFDPGFMGVPTLEVSSHIPVTLRHREAVGCFVYSKMKSQTISYAKVGNYAGQSRTTLPKQFTMPSEWRDKMK